MKNVTIFLRRPNFSGGPRVFLDRILPFLKKQDGISITYKEKSNFDTEFVIVEKKTKHKGNYIVRLDGCYYRKKVFNKNIPIIKTIKNAKHLIFQSEFSYRMCKKLLKFGNKPYDIIKNGIDLKWVKSIDASDKIVPGSFVACSNWRGRDNKRPLSIIRGFLEANTGRHLYFIGEFKDDDIPFKYKSNFIHFLGKNSSEDIISIMKACDYQIHLCHIDSCPNAVIEGLACGLNVLCTNLGGTPELVASDGVILDVDKWNFKVKKFKILDNLPVDVVSNGINDILEKKERCCRIDVDINITASMYANSIKRSVNK